jgi:hypothetical protein
MPGPTSSWQFSCVSLGGHTTPMSAMDKAAKRRLLVRAPTEHRWHDYYTIVSGGPSPPHVLKVLFCRCLRRALRREIPPNVAGNLESCIIVLPLVQVSTPDSVSPLKKPSSRLAAPGAPKKEQATNDSGSRPCGVATPRFGVPPRTNTHCPSCRRY